MKLEYRVNKNVNNKNMKVNILLLLIGLFSMSSILPKVSGVEKTGEVISYGNSIPIFLGIHNEHERKDSLKIQLIDNAGLVVFFHQGDLDGWGTRMIDEKIKTGEYQLIVSWYENKGLKKTQRKILLHSTTEYISLNIELANDPRSDRMHNAIFLDQYTTSLKGVTFSRNWNPEEQYKKDSLLVPDYNVTNNNDSTIYGAWLRYSSQLSINWTHPHSIAFIKFEEKVGADWVGFRCNAPRITMNLKSGEEGYTLKDMILGCSVKNFETKKMYRVRINYMLNDAIVEENPPKDGLEDNLYIEQTIYSFTDEFKFK